MKKAKMIIGSLVVAGIVAAGGTMVKSKAEVNTNDSMEELVKKKKHKKKKKNNNYQQSNFYQNGNWNNGKQQAQNDAARRYEDSNVRYDETVGLPVIRKNDGILLRRTGYTAMYNRDMRIPVWVAWHLTRQHTYGKNSRKQSQFAEDESVQRPRATNFDYMSSGYDRGHMCPAGDNKWDRKALNETFLFTNCCPQLHSLNSGDWNDLEIQCREWAQRYGDIYIVCGPILRGSSHKTIGKNRVVVPEAFFKVLLCMRGTPKAIGFIYEHRSGHRSMSSCAVSVDQVERVTGWDFFASLPDDVERRVEATANFNDWR